MTLKAPASLKDFPSFYALAKVHKAKDRNGFTKWRPIVPANSWLTAPLANIISHMLNIAVKSAPFVVQDSRSLVLELERVIIPSDSTVILTADIESLYTKLDNSFGEKHLRDFLSNVVKWPSVFAQRLAFVNRSTYQANYFVVPGLPNPFRQIYGVAMGIASAPAYANLVLASVECSVVKKFEDNIVFYRRYIDDTLLILKDSSKIDEITSAFNSIHESLVFNFEPPGTSTHFLDLQISVQNRRISLRNYTKPTNRFLSIPFASSHSVASKAGFIITELIRYARNSSSLPAFQESRLLFATKLLERGYSPDFINRACARVNYEDRIKFLTPSSAPARSPFFTRSASSHPRAPFPITYHRLYDSRIDLRSIVRKRYKEFFDMYNQLFETLSPDPPLIVYKADPNLLRLSNAHLAASLDTPTPTQQRV
jgi:hypothetical protein